MPLEFLNLFCGESSCRPSRRRIGKLSEHPCMKFHLGPSRTQGVYCKRHKAVGLTSSTYRIDFLHYLIVSQNLAMLNASLVTAIKCSSVQVWGHAGHGVRWAISVGSSAETVGIVCQRAESREIVCQLGRKVLANCSLSAPHV